MSAEADEGRMTLVEHLTELRRRVIICAVVLVVLTVVVFMFYNRVLHFLSGPYEEATQRDPELGVRRDGDPGLQAHRDRSTRAAPRAGQGLHLRGDRPVRAGRSSGRSGGS